MQTCANPACANAVEDLAIYCVPCKDRQRGVDQEAIEAVTFAERELLEERELAGVGRAYIVEGMAD